MSLRTEPAGHLLIIDNTICPRCGSTSSRIGSCIENDTFYNKQVCDAKKAQADGSTCGYPFLTTAN